MMARVIHPNQRYGLACAPYDAALALMGRHEVLLQCNGRYWPNLGRANRPPSYPL